MPVIYTKGKKYGASSQTIKEVTKAQYEALTEEQKMNGMIYMVIDEDSADDVHVVQEVKDDQYSVPSNKAVYDAINIKNFQSANPTNDDTFVFDSDNGKKKLSYQGLKQNLIGDGFGSSDVMYVSQAEYDALPEDKKNSFIPYYIYDAPGVQQEFREISKAEYDKLSKAEQEDGTFYYITDDDEVPSYKVVQQIEDNASTVPSSAVVCNLNQQLVNNTVKYKDINTSTMNANTWYSYDYKTDSDLKDADILNVFFSAYGTNAFGVSQVNLNKETRIIWYGSSVNAGGSTIRVVYK